MRRFIRNAVFLSVGFIAAGGAAGGPSAEPPQRAIESITTDLGGRSCMTFIDPDDPNDTPYRQCPGVSGYTLRVRRVDAGRVSIDVVTPERQKFPLDYQEFMTRQMFHLDQKAEWRVLRRGGQKTPIALIVRVYAQENLDEPEQVTQVYWTVAKITPEAICVTDRLLDGALSPAQVRGVADLAQDQPCLEPLPPMNGRS